MKERPILFSSPMVQAILAGRKSCTRRVVKPQPHCFQHGVAVVYTGTPGSGTVKEIVCPHGKIGDRLWVRETWARQFGLADSQCTGPENAYFRATCSEARDAMTAWKPSIFMPRWASRITLEITGVKVERLQSISDDDIAAEGVNLQTDDGRTVGAAFYQDRFITLWDEINGKTHPWESNPLVWVISFKRVD